MHPTKDQIRYAAYERWLNRGGAHGYDQSDWLAAEKECTFKLNYRTIVEFRLVRGSSRLLGNAPHRVCRLCERANDEVTFGDECPVLPGSRRGARLLTAEVCADCQSECLAPLADGYSQFLKGRSGFTLGAYKALVATALLTMPTPELAFFPDTIEWVNNPDPLCDAGLFAAATCRAYSMPLDPDDFSISLARRVNDDAALPYIVLFVSEGESVFQIDVPMSLRDQDLDGMNKHSPERSWSCGSGSDFHEAICRTLSLETSMIRRPHTAGLFARV